MHSNKPQINTLIDTYLTINIGQRTISFIQLCDGVNPEDIKQKQSRESIHLEPQKSATRKHSL